MKPKQMPVPNNKNIPLDNSVGMQINRALSSEAKAYIRAGLPPVVRSESTSDSRAAGEDG